MPQGALTPWGTIATPFGLVFKTAAFNHSAIPPQRRPNRPRTGDYTGSPSTFQTGFRPRFARGAARQASSPPRSSSYRSRERKGVGRCGWSARQSRRLRGRRSGARSSRPLPGPARRMALNAGRGTGSLARPPRASATPERQVWAVENCSAVVGSITALSRVTLSAGKPALRACSRILASLSAI